MVGKRGGDVDPREHVAARGDRLAPPDRLVGERFEMRRLGAKRVDARLRHPARRFVQVGRIEAHHPGEHLAMGEARFGRHQRVGMLRGRSEEQTSEVQSLMRISYAVFCWKKKKIFMCYSLCCM